MAVVDGQPLLLFCTNPGSDPIWVVPGPSVTGPWDMTLARPVRCPGLYAPRLVRDGSGAWHLIGFHHRGRRRFRRRAFRSRPGSLHPVRWPGVLRCVSRAADRSQPPSFWIIPVDSEQARGTSFLPDLPGPASGSQARMVPGPRLAHWW